MQKTGIDKKQLKNWFTNARRRIWKPMLKKQIEQGKITAAAGPAAGAAAGCGGAVPGGLLLSGPGVDNPHSIQAMRAHYQQAVQQNQQERQDRGAAAAGAPLQPVSSVPSAALALAPAWFWLSLSQPRSLLLLTGLVLSF
jgi:hypothetical protein